MASTQVETVTSGADKAKLGAAIAMVIAGLVGFYMLGRQGALAQWGVLVLALIVAVWLFFMAETGRQLGAFAVESTREVRKVVWPTRRESLQVTAYVFAFVVVMAIFLWAADKTIEWVFYDLILRWR